MTKNRINGVEEFRTEFSVREQSIVNEMRESPGSKERSEKNTFPSELMITAKLRKPFGLRINKCNLMVTLVEPHGASVGHVSVGDHIVAINHQELKTVKDLNEKLSGKEQEALVTLKRSSFSCCKHMLTTVETLTVEKDSSLKVVRAIEVYKVLIHLESFPDVELSQELGLSVKYDNKEQLQVASVIPGSLASIHLRPGDIIKRINGENVSSKTMFIFWIRHGLEKNKQICRYVKKVSCNT
ncbi:unnamed protein product [Thelazia callipaeda]|uniref:PDZ domain-containing protein n=1 Tax=Thelazia callipaeda TaxID=103827 RepID=A0A0N5DBR7_THECL|nr:unnamed protein product [Thelazia callipaeda]